MTCLFCDQPLDTGATRSAFDPWLGRLWRVCPSCRRWNVVPLEHRWEALEEYERAARDRGRTVLRTEHLDLVDTGDGQLIRVGRAPRPELAGWRYGETVPPMAGRGILAWLRRMLIGLPISPLGYDSGYGAALRDRTIEERWFASPFLDDAPTLTAAFLHVPLASACSACGGPLAVAPWSFQRLRLVADAAGPIVVSTCGLCGREAGAPLMKARPALRLGLSIVNRRLRADALVRSAARRLDGTAGPAAYVLELGRESATLGEMHADERLALGIALDEETEAELLEREWREAEELAAIVDGELTQPERFEEFRRRVLSAGPDG